MNTKLHIPFLIVIGIICLSAPLKCARKHRSHSKLSGYIINGIATYIEEAPYIVQVIKTLKNRCVGTIITESHILTAAACMTWNDDRPIFIRSGTEFSNRGLITRVNESVVHPMYNETFSHNAAILKLSSPLQFTAKAHSITLSSSGPVEGTLATVAGWGKEKPVRRTIHLKSTPVKILSQKKCQSIYDTVDYVFCATYPTSDVCTGDTGAPLAANGSLIGFVAKVGCGVSHHPGVYTDISKIRDFIDNATDYQAIWV